MSNDAIELLRECLRECRDYLYDDSGTPISPMDLRERVRVALASRDEVQQPPEPRPAKGYAAYIDALARARCICPVEDTYEGKHNAGCPLRVPDDRGPRAETITSLCDRVERIFCISIDDSLSHQERIKQIQEWAAGFMRPPSEPPK